jgi:hypothetical protein
VRPCGKPGFAALWVYTISEQYRAAEESIVISRQDFMFCIGFEGNTAIVDASAKRVFGRLSARELAEKGQYKAAVSSAFYNRDAQELAAVLVIYNEKGTVKLPNTDALKRTFGVLETFEEIDRSMYV